MTKMEKPTMLSRRAVLMGAGALVVSVGAPVSLDTAARHQRALAQGAKPPLTPDQLSSYIAVNADGTVSAFFGKMDMGHGLFVAIGQMVAEELDVPFKAVKVYMGDTATSVNQGGASGSTGIQFGGKQMRMAAAEARRVLLEMAAAKLGTPADQLIVIDGVVSAAFNRDKKDVLRRADRRQILQRPARLEQADRQRALCPRQGAAEEAHRLQDRRQADQARGRRAEGVRAGGLLHRHQGAGHGARPHDPSRRRRRGAGEGRRKLDQGHPRAPRWSGTRASSASSPTRNGTRSRRPRSSRSSGRRSSRRSRTRPRSTTTSARRRCASGEDGKTDRQCRRGVQDRRPRDRGRIRMAVPVACRDGPGLRAGRDQGRQGHLLDRLAEVALRAERPCRARSACRATRSAVIWTDGSRLLRPQRCRRLRDGLRRARQGGRQAGAPAIHARARHRLGPEGPGLDPPRPRGDRRQRQRHRLRVHSARDSRASTSTPTATIRSTRWPATPAASS